MEREIMVQLVDSLNSDAESQSSNVMMINILFRSQSPINQIFQVPTTCNKYFVVVLVFYDCILTYRIIKGKSPDNTHAHTLARARTHTNRQTDTNYLFFFQNIIPA